MKISFCATSTITKLNSTILTAESFLKELWQTVNSELKKERSKSQEKLSATQKRRNDLRIQKFQYFIENILPKYDRWNFTVSLSKKYEIVSEQLLQEVKSKTQIEFQRTQELIDSAFTKLANSSNASTESNINTIKTILENYLDSNKEEQEELKKAIHPETKSRSFASTV